MKAALIFPSQNTYGNVIWMPPYLYPIEDLERANDSLTKKGYFISLFPEGDGLTFNTEIDSTQILSDFATAFSWVEFTSYFSAHDCDYEKSIFQEQLIILPIARLNIDFAIKHPKICLFPPGEFNIEKIHLVETTGKLHKRRKRATLKKSGNLRDEITHLTQIGGDVLQSHPLLVFKKKIALEDYLKFSHGDDVDFIRDCSRYADGIMDIIRLTQGDYNNPEFLPSKPGVWNGVRYSCALIYFPRHQLGYIQAREVELKMFGKSIGMDLSSNTFLEDCKLLNDSIGEVGNIARHSLRMNTLILESDEATMKFVQIMMLLDYLGNPNEYEPFKKVKGKLIACLANSKSEYYSLSDHFRYLSEEIRTQIIHNGQGIENLIPDREDRAGLFEGLQSYVIKLIRDMIEHNSLSWPQYENIRNERQKLLIE